MELNLSRPLAFIDLETTGMQVAKDRIVEIAVLKVMPDGNLHEKQDRINPGMPIPAGATAVHKITDADVRDAPSFDLVAKSYYLFLNDCDVAGFNSTRFDVPVLVEEFLRCGISFDLSGRRLVDVQRIFHQMEPRTLGAAFRFYCNATLDDAHAAMADTKATYEVLKAQLSRYPGELKNDLQFLHDLSKDGDFADLGKRMYLENGMEIFNFGKHKGKPVAEVFASEPSYYDWIMKSEFSLEFKDKIRNIRRRMKA